jgi:hypothetical protein
MKCVTGQLLLGGEAAGVAPHVMECKRGVRAADPDAGARPAAAALERMHDLALGLAVHRQRGECGDCVVREDRKGLCRFGPKTQLKTVRFRP